MTEAVATAGPAEGTHSTGSLTPGQVSPLDQVKLFESKYDPVSVEILEGLPVERTWRCLELGPGAGSMATWLAGRADQGSVLAVDVDISHLADVRAPNLTVRQGDVAEQDFAAGSFDLIYARAVFEHLDDPTRTLDRVLNWLAPGGWLVLEDFYYLPPEHATTDVGRTLIAGYLKRMAGQGADLWWGRRLPATLTQAGLTSVASRVTPAGPGQSDVDTELISLRLRQEGHALVDNGLVTAEQLAGFLDSLATGHARDITTLLVSAWGRRAPA